jgi:cyanophycin synthetase
VLVIDYKFICAALRTPASVTGDGSATINELIERTNLDPRRGYGHEKVLTQITIDQFTQKMLDEKGYTLDTIPPKGELVLLKPTANLSTGGTTSAA